MQFQYNERGEMQSVINAQNARLIYQRNQPVNFAKIQQQSTSGKNLWQVQKISYVSAFTGSTIDDTCPFGDAFVGADGENWDFWGIDNMGPGVSSGMEELEDGACYDPFADMGGGGPETCEQCKARQHRICQSGIGRDIGTGTAAGIALVGCIAAGALAVVCVIVGGLFISSGTAIYAYNNYNICEDQIIEKCTQCNR